MIILPRDGNDLRIGCSDAEAFCLMYILSDKKARSRKRIAEEMGCTERCVRLIIGMMKECGLVEVTPWGTKITSYGAFMVNRMGIRFVNVDVKQYSMSRESVGAVVTGAGDRLTDGIDQRNAALAAGGSGCTTWVMREGELIMLPDWRTDLNDPLLAAEIRRKAPMSDGDVLLVAGAKDPYRAKSVVAAVALGFLRSVSARAPSRQEYRCYSYQDHRDDDSRDYDGEPSGTVHDHSVEPFP